MTAAITPRVLLVGGSPSDLDTVITCQEVLDDLGIASDIRVLSAHRTPDAVSELAKSAHLHYGVVIAFAGMAAHLAGVIAAHTLLPVIAVPLSGGAIDGLDAALASLQMPPGVPVAAVAIDGARNGALLAGRILSGAHPELRAALAARLERDRARYDPATISSEIEKRKRARRTKSDG